MFHFLIVSDPFCNYQFSCENPGLARPTDQGCFVIDLYVNGSEYSKAAPIHMSVTLLDSIRAFFWAHQWQAIDPVTLIWTSSILLHTTVNAILSARVHATSIPNGLEWMCDQIQAAKDLTLVFSKIRRKHTSGYWGLLHINIPKRSALDYRSQFLAFVLYWRSRTSYFALLHAIRNGAPNFKQIQDTTGSFSLPVLSEHAEPSAFDG